MNQKIGSTRMTSLYFQGKTLMTILHIRLYSYFVLQSKVQISVFGKKRIELQDFSKGKKNENQRLHLKSFKVKTPTKTVPTYPFLSNEHV